MMIWIFNTWIQELQGTADDKSFPVMSQNIKPLVHSYFVHTSNEYIFHSHWQKNSKSKRRIALQKTELVYGLSRSPFRRFGRGTGLELKSRKGGKVEKVGKAGKGGKRWKSRIWLCN